MSADSNIAAPVFGSTRQHIVKGSGARAPPGPLNGHFVHLGVYSFHPAWVRGDMFPP